jgi:hypothetical protein
MMTTWRIVTSLLLGWALIQPGQADTLPETTLLCSASHVYENRSPRPVALTVQVFNGCTQARGLVEINLLAPDRTETLTFAAGRGERLAVVHADETRSVSLLVPPDGAVQVRGPGGIGRYRSTFSVVVR